MSEDQKLDFKEFREGSLAVMNELDAALTKYIKDNPQLPATTIFSGVSAFIVKFVTHVLSSDLPENDELVLNLISFLVLMAGNKKAKGEENAG